MSASPQDDPVAVRPAEPAAAPNPTPRTRGGGVGLALLGLALAVAALVFAGLLWQKLSVTQQELARRAQDSATEAADARRLAEQAEALTQELQARLAVAELRLSEVSLQRSQLEELMLSLSRSRDDNLVQDLESALRLALQHAQLTGSAQPLISALQAADQRIARAAQPRLNPVQRAIARDVDRLRGSALADIPSLALQLDELARQVDDWPLLNQVGPGHPVTPARPRKEVPGATQPVARDVQATEADAAPPAQGWTRVTAWWSTWWERIVADVTRSGRELVRVSRIDRPEALLLAPDQALFLRENLKLKLLNARLGLLARHMRSAQADLIAVETALVRYFDTSATSIKQAQTSLSQLRKELGQSDMPRPEETLAALSAAAGGR
ncbi:uroporphyrinogen-III C-methyltransferase [Hydrogenophaga sp.]|uniref:uroporphyrinogen-III C-methyltransferase n=1 Tax=Hydrogenophaga sp. TaxID=1904254 RepID=UPI002630737F|nr:uroporphyrinogen-III C-methyltransferase [Hydrogenophaga sp.]MCW5654435.1 uroporphyrinogen-III C-methyltransferase [Hydrogenophaga sp.]